MKVWVVEFGEYSDRYVSGIYSTEENAQIAAQGKGEVTEFDVDPAIDEFRSGLRVFCIKMDKEGNVLKVDEWGYFPDLVPNYRVTFQYPNGKRPATTIFEGQLWAKDVEQAIKATNEQRGIAIADGRWDAEVERSREVDERMSKIEAKVLAEHEADKAARAKNS